jgi:hypothetical protein
METGKRIMVQIWEGNGWEDKARREDKDQKNLN